MNKSLLLLLALVAAALLANVFVSCGDDDDDDDDDSGGEEDFCENYPDNEYCEYCYGYGLMHHECNPAPEIDKWAEECINALEENKGDYPCFYKNCAVVDTYCSDFSACRQACYNGYYD